MSTTNHDESIKSSKFCGHQGSVLCLDTSSDPSYPFLLSGSEDATARLWDLRNHRRRACLCIQADGEVLSAVFAPRQPTAVSTLLSDQSTSPKLEGIFALDFTVYLSVGNGVYGYDLRNASIPIIRNPTTNYSSILQNQDEVNQIQVSYAQQPQQTQKGNNKRKSGGKSSNSKSKNNKIPSQSPLQQSLYLAAADDAGTVRVMNTSTLTGSSTPSSEILHHDPNGVAVVPACAFRPRCTKGLELASGGTDCKIHLWDILKPRRPIASYTITPTEDATEETSKPQVCNPPMVHTLAWSNSGRLLASGLGDGNCCIFGVENRSLVQVGLLKSGHDASVASILFPSFSSSPKVDPINNTISSTTVPTYSSQDDRIVLSAGSDGAILCWDLGSVVSETLGGRDADHVNKWDPSSLFPPSLLQTPRNAGLNTPPSLDELSLLDRPRILFGIPHGSKPNWMVSRNNPATLFVADTSNDITAYTIPLR